MSDEDSVPEVEEVPVPAVPVVIPVPRRKDLDDQFEAVVNAYPLYDWTTTEVEQEFVNLLLRLMDHLPMPIDDIDRDTSAEAKYPNDQDDRNEYIRQLDCSTRLGDAIGDLLDRAGVHTTELLVQLSSSQFQRTFAGRYDGVPPNVYIAASTLRDYGRLKTYWESLPSIKNADASEMRGYIQSHDAYTVMDPKGTISEFNGSDPQWSGFKLSVQALLSSYGLDNMLEEKAKVKPETFFQDSWLYRVIYEAVKKCKLRLLFVAEDTKGKGINAWQMITSLYDTENRKNSLRAYITGRINELKLEDGQSTSEFILKVEGYVAWLTELKHTFTENDIVTDLLTRIKAPVYKQAVMDLGSKYSGKLTTRLLAEQLTRVDVQCNRLDEIHEGCLKAYGFHISDKVSKPRQKVVSVLPREFYNALPKSMKETWDKNYSQKGRSSAQNASPVINLDGNDDSGDDGPSSKNKKRKGQKARQQHAKRAKTELKTELAKRASASKMSDKAIGAAVRAGKDFN